MSFLKLDEKESLCSYLASRIEFLDDGGITHGDFSSRNFARHSFDNNDKAFSEGLDRTFVKMVVPSPSDNKALISTWMSFWPLVVIWWVLGDLLVNFWNYIVDKTASLFKAVSKFASRGIIKEI
jgi:hypothetical protein